jgi:hypothetical protein
MFGMNKKGLAEVVGVIALILITATASVIIAVNVNKVLFNSEIQLSSQSTCLDWQRNLVIQMNSACYNSESGDIELILTRKVSSLEIPLLDFAINSGSDSESYRCGNSCGNCNVLGIGATKTYYFASEEVQKGKAVVHIDGCQLDEKEIRVCK